MSDPGIEYLPDDVVARVTSEPWKSAVSSTGTYHPIMLPPTNVLKTSQQAKDWVAETKRILSQRRSELDMRSALDTPWKRNDGKGHLIMIMSSEFSFNGGPTGPKAGNPIAYEIFEECLKGVTDAIKSHTDKNGQHPTICLALSAVVSYPVFNEEGKQFVENALFVTNNKVEGFQKIVKHARDMTDGFDATRYFDFKMEKSSVNSPERLKNHTHSIRDFNATGDTLVIGMGTCRDSAFENYPGTHLMIFAGSAMNENILDKHQGGFLWNDTSHSRDPLNAGAGWRSFSPPGLTWNEARREWQLMEKYKANLLAEGKTPAEVDALVEAVQKGTMTMKDEFLASEYVRLLKADGNTADQIAATVAASKVDGSRAKNEKMQRLANGNVRWEEPVKGRPIWSDPNAKPEIIAAWHTALKDQGKSDAEILTMQVYAGSAEIKPVLDGVGFVWPTDLKTTAAWYRSADYAQIDGGVTVGKARPLPKTELRKPNGEMLPFVEMHLFKDHEEVLEAYQKAAAAATVVGEPAPVEIAEVLDLYEKAKAKAERDGTPFETNAWAESIFKNRRDPRELPELLRPYDPVPRADHGSEVDNDVNGGLGNHDRGDRHPDRGKEGGEVNRGEGNHFEHRGADGREGRHVV